MGPRFKERIFCFFYFLLLLCFFSSGLLFAADTKEITESNSSDALEMIAQRMKTLSASLNEMPDPPQLNQSMQIDFLEDVPESSSESPSEQKPPVEKQNSSNSPGQDSPAPRL